MSKQDYLLKFKWALLPLLCVACGYTLAAADQRIVEWEYHPNTVYSLFIPVGSHIHIALEEGEKFLNLGSGNTSAIDVGAEGSQLVIKAHDSVTHSNLTLITDRRVYIFDYTAAVLKAASNQKIAEPARLYPFTFAIPRCPPDPPTRRLRAITPAQI